ncbi:MAG TPA: hypothetical protein VHQ66_01755 [Myxococcota bacterium]|nr:hypothetical protein [Myxococcota bacterium]
MTRPPTLSRRAAVLGIALTASCLIAGRPRPANDLPGTGSQLFLSPQVRPVALSGDGALVYAVNTNAGTLAILEATPPFAKLAEVRVGLDPVGLAVRPKLNPGDAAEDEQVFVTNHLSDSIAVVSRQRRAVVDVIQSLDAQGVSTSDEPSGVAFDGRNRAFVALDRRNELASLTPGGDGRFQIAQRAVLTAQAPRALAVANGRVYVAAFESGNHTEFPSCGPNDPVSFDRGNPVDEGCLFPLNIANLLAFAANPNLGGEVIRDSNIPDRDLFVYDAANLATAPQTVSGLGTLFYGVAASGTRLYLTHADARNDQDGLLDLANRMFENRLSFLECTPSCGAATSIDLDAGPLGVPTPTPYGVTTSADGATVLVTVAGSDGLTGIPGAPGTSIPGLLVLNRDGLARGSVRLGALPQGVALRSDAQGRAQTAFVLNTGDTTLSVVDVQVPTAPAVVATVSIGTDPTPAAVRRGRILFAAARGSTSGTFSCESCHPNGNMDQLLWVINTLESPTDLPGCDTSVEDCPEPRSTMPVRGLQDTLPLHWVGTLGDPFPGVFLPEDDGAPDCNLGTDGEAGCIRHLVDASMAGVMCAQPGCPPGPAGQPGAFTAAERDDVAAFLTAVAYPPSPLRRPSDVLTATALTGVGDFFLDRGGAIANPFTCGDLNQGCHALPLGVATNSLAVGRFDAPTMRGIWDRHLLFSNGLLSSEEFLVSQGFPPQTTGMTEFRSLAATFPSLFTVGYGVPVGNVWQFFNEMSVGLPGLAGRQLVLLASNRGDATTEARANQIEQAAAEGRVTAVARIGANEWRFKAGAWLPPSGPGRTRDDLRSTSEAAGLPLVLTAELPERMQAGGASRAPLLWVLDGTAGPAIPRVQLGSSRTFTVFAAAIEPGARVLVDGVLCAACGASFDAVAGDVDITVAPVPAAGTHVVQVQNVEGFASNELPIVTVP